MVQSRRDFLTAAAKSLPAIAAPGIARGVTIQPATPTQRIGPFYPEVRPSENAMDLTRIGASDTRAKGQIVTVSGRVLDRAGKPIGSAIILIWQADATGRYGHSRDGGPAAADARFLGHDLMRTGRDGSFSLTTFRPGPYADNRSESGLRTPHIHYEIIGETGRLITEMYFPDEPLNDRDANIAEAKARGDDPALLTAVRDGGRSDDVMALRWSVFLDQR